MTEEILTEEKIDALYQQRLDKASEMREEGVNPYANDFRVDTRAVEFFNTYDAIESKEEVDAIETVHRMAGRVMAVNKFGKAAFIRVQDGTADSKRENGEYTDRYQVYVRKNSVDEASFQAFKRLDIGDFVGISGTPMRTKTGELTLNATEFRVLTKSLRPLPEKWHGLSDVETRYRQRYLDLVSNDEVRRVFRSTLEDCRLAS